jgi:hypothetical protein
MNEINKENKMNKVHGVILNHEYQFVIHDKDCKEYLSPRLSALDRAQYDSAYIDRFLTDLDLDNKEEKENLSKVISQGLWGGDSLLTTYVYMKCTGKVSRKKLESVFWDNYPTSYEEVRDSLYTTDYNFIRKSMYQNGDYTF